MGAATDFEDFEGDDEEPDIAATSSTPSFDSLMLNNSYFGLSFSAIKWTGIKTIKHRLIDALAHPGAV